MSFPKNFYQGGATAANQYEGGWNEGGRGPAMTDVTTGATKDTPRYGTYRNADGTTGKMSMFGGTLPEGAEYACSECQFLSQEFIQMEMMKSQTRKDQISIVVYLKNCISMVLSHQSQFRIMTILCIWKKNWAAGKIVKQMGYMKSIVTVFLKSIKIQLSIGGIR